MSAALSIEARAARLFGAPAMTFDSPDAAVIWAMPALEPYGEAPHRACCQPQDIARVIDRLYRQRTIHMEHVRALRLWAIRGRAPCPVENRADWKLWDEAMRALQAPLQLRGIVR